MTERDDSVDITSYDTCLMEEQPLSRSRTRKVTITEFTENNGDWAMIDNTVEDFYEEPIMINMEEAFEMLDELVQGWKGKLEDIIGNGLKQLRKNNKEKKLMMKYLPGESENIQQAKIDIFKDWKIRFNKTIGETHKRLEILNQTQIKKAGDVMNGKILNGKTNDVMNVNKKTIVNLEFDTGNGYGTLKQLMKDLEKVCSVFHTEQNLNRSVPIYNQHYNSFVQKKFETPFMKQETIPRPFQALEVDSSNHVAIKNMLEGLKMRTTNKKEPVDQRKIKSKCLESKKSSKVKSLGKYKMLQMNKNGKERFFIIKKKPKITQEEAEDIFREWLDNLEFETNHAKKCKQKVRKLSHRFIRKQMIKDNNVEALTTKPMLYADVVKKNLKLTQPNMEDIFESWKKNLVEKIPKKIKPKIFSEEEYEDYFKVWRHNMNAEKCEQRRTKRKAIEPIEEIFSTAKIHHKQLESTADFDENQWIQWRANLILKTKTNHAHKKCGPAPLPENIFQDWIRNLQVSGDQSGGAKRYHKRSNQTRKKNKVNARK